MWVKSAPPVVTPSGGSFCHGEEVVFICQVEDTERLVWKSNKYIGTGGDELAFSAVSPSRDVRANGYVNGTNAVLISANGGRIESALHLHIQFNGTVSCIADPPGQMTNITISIIIGKYFKHARLIDDQYHFKCQITPVVNLVWRPRRIGRIPPPLLEQQLLAMSLKLLGIIVSHERHITTT